MLSQDPSWIVLVCFWFHASVEWWLIMSSNVDSLAGRQLSAAASPSTPLPGMFLGLALYLGSDRLYDLVDNIPDVMGLRALFQFNSILYFPLHNTTHILLHN